MTIVKTVRIGGCSKELGTSTFVDLSEPEKIGQHPNLPEHYCYITPLDRDVILNVTTTGGVVDDGRNPKYAEVIINCTASDCLFHK
jgi:hypothetical protein